MVSIYIVPVAEYLICFTFRFMRGAVCALSTTWRLSHIYIHRAAQFVFCKEISNLNSVIGWIITK